MWLGRSSGTLLAFNPTDEGRIDASAMECEAEALQRSWPYEALRIAAGFGSEFDEPIALPNGRDAPMT